MDVLRDNHLGASMPARTIQDEDHLLGRGSASGLRKRREFDREERGMHAGGQVPERAARGGMDKADEVAPLVAVLHWGERPLATKRPDFGQDRFETDAMFIAGPDLHVGVRVGGGYIAAQLAEPPLKASWAAGSACTWRGRGTTRRRPNRRR